MLCSKSFTELDVSSGQTASPMADFRRAGNKGVSDALRGGAAVASAPAAAAAAWLWERLLGARESLRDIPEAVGQATAIAGAMRLPQSVGQALPQQVRQERLPARCRSVHIAAMQSSQHSRTLHLLCACW
jgi:hypothetical protein